MKLAQHFRNKISLQCLKSDTLLLVVVAELVVVVVVVIVIALL